MTPEPRKILSVLRAGKEEEQEKDKHVKSISRFHQWVPKAPHAEQELQTLTLSCGDGVETMSSKDTRPMCRHGFWEDLFLDVPGNWRHM